jgi:putative phage-type endonuclease
MLIHDIEQNTPEWLELRAGMPTASAFSKIITSTGAPSKSLTGYAMELAGELYAGKPLDAWEGNAHTQRGHDLEPEAASLYEFANDVELQTVGFVTDDAQTYGCSPDRLAGDDGIVEIKCQAAKGHIETMMYFDKNGKCPASYVPQVQGQLFICARKWADLVFYHPELPPLTIRQEIDPEFSVKLLAQITATLHERDEALKIIRKHAGE